MTEVRDYTLEYLRYIRQAVDDLKVDGIGLKGRQTALEIAMVATRKDLVAVEEAIARQSQRFDRLDAVLDRIERRLGLRDDADGAKDGAP